MDDVSTKSATLEAGAECLMSMNPELLVDAAIAGQMIVRSAVADDRSLLAKAN